VEYTPLSQIKAASRNPKLHASQEIRASISRFGLAELPLLDERTGRLVAGHGRVDQLLEMQQAGQDPPDGVQVDPKSGEWFVPVQRGWASRSDDDAEAYVITSNNLTTLGGWDNQALTTVLQDLAAVDSELLALTGFTEDDLSQLLDADLPRGDDKAPPDDFPEYDEKTITTEHTCPSCGYQWSGGKITVSE
jgi:hypothetical protein